jgi:hypothetical protein
MLPDAREFYKLERLWGDAPAMTLTDAGATKAVPRVSKKAIDV